MADINPVRKNIPLQGAQSLSAVSENLIQTLGAENNFINYFQVMDKRFNFNGLYGEAPSYPIIAADGLDVFEFDSQIIDVWLFVRVAGSSGTTEIDIQVADTPAGPWVSIFTTTPKISFNAGSYTWVGAVNPSIVGSAYNPSPSYAAPSNTVAGVLNTAVTNARPKWSAMRCNLTTAQGGSPDGCGVLLRYRPITI